MFTKQCKKCVHQPFTRVQFRVWINFVTLSYSPHHGQTLNSDMKFGKITIIGPQYLIVLSLFCASQITWANSNTPGFHPELNTQLSHEDNIRRSPKSDRQTDSILALQPTLPLRWHIGKHSIDLTYTGDYAKYFKHSKLDYDSHELSSQLSLDLDNRLNSQLELGHNRNHYVPGDNNIAATNIDESLNRWQENHLKASLTYGTAASQGQLKIEFKHKQRRHDNDSLSALDINQTSLSTHFYYRLTKKTRLPFQVSITKYDYQDLPLAFSPNSTSYTYLTGLSWEATAKSTGILQFGWLNKHYEQTLFHDTTMFTLLIDGIWEPNTYTKVIFGVKRDTQESLQASSKAYIQNHIHSEITHMLTPRTKLFFSTQYTAAKEDSANSISEDRFNLRIEAWQDLLRWLDVGVSYQDIVRKSSNNNFDFDAHVFMVEAKVRL